MTDTNELKNGIVNSGYRMRYISSKLGLSHQGFLNKLNGKSEFKASEIIMLCNLLNIDESKRNSIFFTVHVDKTSTPTL